MKTRMKCENPNDIEFTIQITASAKEWEQLRDELDKLPIKYPVIILSRQINDVLSQARKIYWANDEE